MKKSSNDIMREIKYLCGSTSIQRVYQYNGCVTGHSEIDRLFFARKGGIPSSNRISDWFHFLGEPDVLTDAIYGKPDEHGNILYPFAIENHPGRVKEHVGPIGDQYGRWHLETLQEHVAMVAARLLESGLSATESATLAVLHDIGKKYTAGTNSRGEMCFYGHAVMSAIIVAIHGRCLPYFLTTWDLRVGIGVVYGHTFPWSEWSSHPEKKQMYLEELIDLFDGDATEAYLVIRMIERLDSADVGCKTFEELEEARKPGGIIDRGWALLTSR